MALNCPSYFVKGFCFFCLTENKRKEDLDLKSLDLIAQYLKVNSDGGPKKRVSAWLCFDCGKVWEKLSTACKGLSTACKGLQVNPMWIYLLYGKFRKNFGDGGEVFVEMLLYYHNSHLNQGHDEVINFRNMMIEKCKEKLKMDLVPLQAVEAPFDDLLWYLSYEESPPPPLLPPKPAPPTPPKPTPRSPVRILILFKCESPSCGKIFMSRSTVIEHQKECVGVIEDKRRDFKIFKSPQPPQRRHRKRTAKKPEKGQQRCNLDAISYFFAKP